MNIQRRSENIFTGYVLVYAHNQQILIAFLPLKNVNYNHPDDTEYYIYRKKTCACTRKLASVSYVKINCYKFRRYYQK